MNIALNDSRILSYDFFYATAIIAAVIILSIQGRAFKFQFLPWVVTFVSCLVVFIIGCTLITFKTAEWKVLLTGDNLYNEHVGASVLGGLLFSIPVIFTSKYFYSFSSRMLDAFAFVLPAGMAIQRIGCFLAGCCYGNLSELPWSVTYHGIGTSISLHPVQLYESVGCILVMIALHFATRVLKQPGNLFLFSGLCYLLVRFVCEVFRVHDIATISGREIFGLTVIQFVLIILILMAAIVIVHRESTPKVVKNKVRPIGNRTLIIHLSLLIAIILFVSPWLRPFDVIILFGLVLIPASISLWSLYQTYLMVPNFRLTIVSLLALSIVLMSQQSSTSSKRYKTIRTYNTITFGASTQELNLKKQIGTSSSDCGTTPIFTYFNVKNTSGALSIARTWAKENNIEYTIGLNSYVSSVREEVSGASIGNNNYTFVGFNPNFITTFKNAELTLGVHVGTLRRIKTNLDPATQQQSVIGSSNVFPQLGLRVGNPRIFFVNAQMYNSPFGVMPSSPFSISGGSGFGSKRGNFLELGHSSFATLFISSKLAIDDKVFIKPFIGLGTGLLNRLDDNQKGFTFALQLSARFGQKDKSK
jgi:prolipoprotein diacylglyceryltransferase